MRYASTAQINYIESLISQKGYAAYEIVCHDLFSFIYHVDDLTMRQASRIIDGLLTYGQRDEVEYDEFDDFDLEYSEAEMDAMFATLDC